MPGCRDARPPAFGQLQQGARPSVSQLLRSENGERRGFDSTPTDITTKKSTQKKSKHGSRKQKGEGEETNPPIVVHRFFSVLLVVSFSHPLELDRRRESQRRGISSSPSRARLAVLSKPASLSPSRARHVLSPPTRRRRSSPSPPSASSVHFNRAFFPRIGGCVVELRFVSCLAPKFDPGSAEDGSKPLKESETKKPQEAKRLPVSVDFKSFSETSERKEDIGDKKIADSKKNRNGFLRSLRCKGIKKTVFR